MSVSIYRKNIDIGTINACGRMCNQCHQVMQYSIELLGWECPLCKRLTGDFSLIKDKWGDDGISAIHNVTWITFKDYDELEKALKGLHYVCFDDERVLKKEFLSDIRNQRHIAVYLNLKEEE
jgi:hypothetical protein